MQLSRMLRTLVALLAAIVFSSLASAKSDHSSRETALNRTSFSTDQECSIKASQAKCNDYPLSCVEDKQTTLNCQKEPYKYYCDSKGKPKYSKRQTAYCDWCDCINLNPKPAGLINLIGQAQCARDLDNATVWEGIDEFGRAQAIKKQQQTMAESTEAELSIKSGGPVPQLSSAALHDTPMWAKKLSTIVGTITSLTIPSRNSVKDCTVHNNSSDHGCELETRDSMKKKPKKVQTVL